MDHECERIVELVMFAELPSPFYYLPPVSQFYTTLIASSITILLFSYLSFLFKR